jgi:hypothetical protein
MRTGASALYCALLASSAGLPASVLAQESLRWYPRHHTVVDTVAATDTLAPRIKGITIEAVSPLAPNRVVRKISIKNTQFWAGPSLGFDAFVRESGTGAYKTGIIPGVGYGLKWGKKPDANGNSKAWLAVDLFISGAVSEEDSTHAGADYFNIDAVPVVTVFDWVSMGWGPRFKVGLNGLGNVRRTLFSFGIRKAT